MLLVVWYKIVFYVIIQHFQTCIILNQVITGETKIMAWLTLIVRSFTKHDVTKHKIIKGNIEDEMRANVYLLAVW